jgi:hypothetical protein
VCASLLSAIVGSLEWMRLVTVDIAIPPPRSTQLLRASFTTITPHDRLGLLHRQTARSLK